MSEENKAESLSPQVQQVLEKFLETLSDALAKKDREAIRSVYANLVQFENNDLDIKILFGILSQPSGKRVPEWHTAVTMTWAEAKALSYYLRINLVVYEAEHGTVKMPASMLPTTFAAPSGDLADNPTATKTFEKLQAIRSELMEEQLSLIPKPAGTE